MSRFEIESESAGYLVEETVARGARLKFDNSVEVKFVIGGRKVKVRLPNGKERKAKLLDS